MVGAVVRAVGVAVVVVTLGKERTVSGRAGRVVGLESLLLVALIKIVGLVSPVGCHKNLTTIHAVELLMRC